MTTFRVACPPFVRLAESGAIRMNVASAAGVALFYLYMLIPVRVQELIAVFRLQQPEDASRYGVGYPYLTGLDLLILVYVAWMTFSGRRRRGGAANWPLRFYLAASIAVTGLMAARVALGLERPLFLDSVVWAVRVAVGYSLFIILPGVRRVRTRTLLNAMVLMVAVSFVLNFAGFANRDTPSNLAGRMNLSGLDFTSAGHWAAALVLASLAFTRGRQQLLFVAAGVAACLFAGARNPLPFLAVAVGLLAYQRGALPRSWLVVPAGALLAAWVASAAVPSLLDHIPVLNRTRDYAVYYPKGVAPAPRTLSAIPLLGSLPLTDAALVGRINTWDSALRLVPRALMRPSGSDWAVQQQLASLGIIAHAHNAYLQTAIKFGLLALPIWAAVFAGTWRGWRARSPYAVILAFLLGGFLVDYWLLSVKAAVLFFVVVRLNADWIRERDSLDVTAGAGARARVEAIPVG